MLNNNFCVVKQYIIEYSIWNVLGAFDQLWHHDHKKQENCELLSDIC